MRKERDSNMELLRIVAMFLVLVVHADFFSLGGPTKGDIEADAASAFTRMLFQGLSIVCVDVFVLLSGWYGIRPKKVGFLNFVFQCLFFLLGIYAVCILTGFSAFSRHGVMGCFLLIKWNWFIRAYLLLYLLAPMLNTYIDHATERQHRMMLLLFFLFQTIFSWLTNASVFFEHGYSTISFIGLYLLARYFSKYPTRFGTLSKKWLLACYLATALILALMYFGGRVYGISGLCSRLFYYDNPLVVFSSLSLVLCFSKLKFKSKMVNWLGASSFAVFLLHTNPNLCKPLFVPLVKQIYVSANGIECLACIFVFLVTIFVCAVLIDQVRLMCWRKQSLIQHIT